MGNTIGLPACPKGNSMTFNVIVNQNGLPIDITGYSFSFIAGKDLSGKLQAPVRIGWIQNAPAANGQTSFSVPNSLTSTLDPGSYYYNLDMADLMGNVTTIMAGTWPITAVPGVMTVPVVVTTPPTPPSGGGGTGTFMLTTEYVLGAGQSNPNEVDHAMWADAAPITGDMLKSVYDPNADGIVDKAESVPWSGVTGTTGVVELLVNKGAPSGYASLDINGRVLNTQLPFIMPEAPTDGTTYGRRNATWAFTIGEAPTDGQFYGRQSGAWIALQPQGVLNYSTNEQFTGRLWIDGRNVYQKTISLGTLPTGSNLITVTHNIAFLALILHHDAWGYDSVNNAWTPVANPGAYSILVQPTTITITSQGVSSTASYTGYLTLYYTCTNR
jgi:hypothetical protein